MLHNVLVTKVEVQKYTVDNKNENNFLSTKIKLELKKAPIVWNFMQIK